MAGKVVAVRSNSVPAGGPTALQAKPPTLTPADIQALVDQLLSVITKFRKASSPQSVQLNQRTLQLGQQDTAKIASVGLGYRIISEHTVTINVSNTNAAAETIDISPWFPWILLSSTEIKLNGEASIYNADGVGGLAVAARSRRGFFNSPSGSQGPSLALCRVSFGAGLTPAASTSFSLSGYSSVSIAATTNNAPITVTFYTIEKVAYSRDSLLGALPLQNNQVFATVVRQPAGTLLGGTSPRVALHNAADGVSATLGSWTTNATYKFWGVPSDPALYRDMISNSYQVIRQAANVINATGDQALRYEIPLNQYLVAMHLIAWDSTGAPLPQSDFQKLLLQYSGGAVTPVNHLYGPTRAEQFADYGADLATIPGYALIDGDNTAESLTQTDDAGWLDTYSVANPELVGTIATGVSVPATYDVIRESVIPGAVQVVGGVA